MDSPADPDKSRLKSRLSALASPFKTAKGLRLKKRSKHPDREDDSDRDAKDANRKIKKKQQPEEPDDDLTSRGVEGETEGGSGEEGKGMKKKGARSRAGALVRRLGSLGTRRASAERRSSGSSSLTPGSVKRRTPDGEDRATDSSLHDDDPDMLPLARDTSEETVSLEDAGKSFDENKTESSSSKISEDDPPVTEDIAAIATTHPVSTLPFAVSTWKPKKSLRAPEIERPIESPSPEDALRRRISFVAQDTVCVSEDKEDPSPEVEEEGSPASRLSRMVQLARLQRVSGGTPSAEEDRSDEEYEDTQETRPVQPAQPPMPPFGDLIDAPDSAPVSEPQDDMGSGTSSTQAGAVGGLNDRREHLYKILVIGELGTGKTSIIKRYVHQFFSQHYRATIGVDFALKVLNWDSNTTIRLQLWDIAGQERFGNMTRVYYKEAVGAFIVFDVTRVATFEAVVKWKQDLDSKVQLPDGSPIPCVLLANKCDQQKEGIVNTPAKMEEYCREKGFAGWHETSAKENINIEEAARSLVNKILLNDKLIQSNDSRDSNVINDLGQNGAAVASSSKSCAC